ncbi:MAG: hypothetical protein ACOYD4_01110 [Solirubrobacterales bacterium]
MRLLASLFAVSVLVLGISVWPACSPDAARVSERLGPGRPAPPALPWRPLRVECGQPATLALRRFEDGSAWLLCAGRVLARVSVPG